MLFERALFLAYRCFSLEEIIDELASLNENYCDPPLPHHEIVTISESAYSYVGEDKRAELIRSFRSAVVPSKWSGARAKNIRSILLTLLSEHISRYEVRGSDSSLEVTISRRRIAERSGLSYRTVKKIFKEGFIPDYVLPGRPPKGKNPGSLIIPSRALGIHRFPNGSNGSNDLPISSLGGCLLVKIRTPPSPSPTSTP